MEKINLHHYQNFNSISNTTLQIKIATIEILKFELMKFNNNNLIRVDVSGICNIFQCHSPYVICYPQK